MKSGSPLSVAPEVPQQQDKSASANKAVRKRKSKRRKKGPQDEDDFWGHSGRCRSLEVVGVRSVLSSRTPSRCNTPLLAEAGGSSGGTLRGFRSREILLKIQRKVGRRLMFLTHDNNTTTKNKLLAGICKVAHPAHLLRPLLLGQALPRPRWNPPRSPQPQRDVHARL